jgi:hypothetical protein
LSRCAAAAIFFCRVFALCGTSPRSAIEINLNILRSLLQRPLNGASKRRRAAALVACAVTIPYAKWRVYFPRRLQWRRRRWSEVTAPRVLKNDCCNAAMWRARHNRSSRCQILKSVDSSIVNSELARAGSHRLTCRPPPG